MVDTEFHASARRTTLLLDCIDIADQFRGSGLQPAMDVL